MRLDGLPDGIPLQADAAGDRASLQASIRPQSLYLGAGPDGAVPLGAVSVVGRTYLGEYWHYLVQPSAGGAPLKVHAAPSLVLEIGQQSMMYVDPYAVAAVQ